MKWVKRAALALFVVLALFVLLLVAIDTSAGHELIRRTAISVLDESVLTGRAEVGAIEGSIYGDLHISGIRVIDAAGRTAISVDRLRVAYDLGALFSGRVRVEAIELDRPEIHAVEEAGGRFNLQTLVRPSEKAAEEEVEEDVAEPSQPDIELSKLEIRGGRFTHEARGLKRELADISLALTATVAGSEHRARAGLELAIDAGRIELDDFVLDLDTLEANGRLRIGLPQSFVEALAMDPQLRADLQLDVDFTPGPPEMPLKLVGRGSLSGAPIELEALAGLAGAKARIALSKLDLSRAHAAAPPIVLDIALAADATPEGVEARGSVASSQLDVNWSALLALTAPPKLERAEVDVRARKLSALAPGLIPLDGAVEVAARAHGPLDALEVEAKVRGSTLAIGGIAIGAVEVEAHAGGIPAAAAGRAELEFRDFSLAAPKLRFPKGAVHARFAEGGRIASVELDVEGRDFIRKIALAATATQSADAVAIALRELLVDTPPATWVARNGSVTLAGGAVEIGGLELASERAGKIAVKGAIDPARFPDAPSRVDFQVAALDVSAFAGLAPEMGPIAGKIDVAGWLASTGGVASASVAVDAKDLRRGSAGPLQLQTRAQLEGGKISGRVELSGTRIGQVVARGRGIAPKNPLGDAWLTEGEIEEIAGTIDSLSIGGLAAMTSTAARFGGSVNGRFAIGARVEHIEVELAAEKIEAPALALPVNVGVKIAAGLDRATANIIGAMKGAPVMRVDLETTAGIGAWRLHGARALEELGARLDLRAENVPAKLLAELGRLDPADPRFSAPNGSVTLEIAATGAAKHLRVSAAVKTRALAFAEKAPPLDLTLTATLADRTVRAALDGSLRDHGRVKLDAEAEVGNVFDAEAMKSLGPGAVRSVRGSVENFRLVALRELGLGASIPRGRVTMGWDLGPALESGAIDVDVEELEVDRQLAPLAVRAAVALGRTAQTVTATVSARAAPAIVLRASAGASIAALAEGRAEDPAITAHVESRGFPVEKIFAGEKMARVISGRLGLSATIEGTARHPLARAEVSLADAKLGGAAFGAFGARVAYSGDSAHVEVQAVEKGSLAVRADITALDRESPQIDGEVSAAAFDLAFAGPVARTLAGAALGLDGKLDGRLAISGSVAAPAIAGDLHFTGIRAVLPGAPAIESTKLDLAIAPSRIDLALAGKLGGGQLEVALGADVAPGFSRVAFGGKVETRGVRVSAGTQAAAIDATIELSGRKEPADFDAAVTIGPLLVTLPNQKSRRLRVIEAFEDVEYVDVLGAPRAIEEEVVAKTSEAGGRLHVVVKTNEPIVVRGGDNDLRIGVDLTLAGQGGEQRMTGNIEVERGRLALLGKTYQFRRGLISFPGQFPPDPRLDIQLEHDFESLTLLILVSGTGRKPEVRFASEPGGYSQSELLSFFIGSGPEDKGGGKEGGAGRVGGALIASQLSGAQEVLPIDTVDLDLGEGTSRSGSVTTGKWITDDVFVAYTYRFTPRLEENRSEGAIRWHFARGWTLETRFGDASSGGVEAMWLRRF